MPNLPRSHNDTALADDAFQQHPDAHQAREYLEKICQDIHHLPIPNQQVKADYLMKLLRELDINGSSQSISRQTHQSAIQNVLQTYNCLPANPRKIKALGNRLALQLRAGCFHTPLIKLNVLDSIFKFFSLTESALDKSRRFRQYVQMLHAGT